MRITKYYLFTCVTLLIVFAVSQSAAIAQVGDSKILPAKSCAYMDAAVTLEKAPNGAIANKMLLDRVDEVVWSKPTIEQPAKGIWTLGGFPCPM